MKHLTDNDEHFPITTPTQPIAADLASRVYRPRPERPVVDQPKPLGGTLLGTDGEDEVCLALVLGIEMGLLLGMIICKFLALEGV